MSGSSDAVIADWLHDRMAPVIGWAQRHPHALDALTASVIAVTSLVGIALQGHRLQHPDVLVFCVALPAPLLTRTVDRRLAFGLVALVALVQWITSTPQLADAAVLVALFWVALDGELTEMALAGAIAETGAVMAALRWSPHQPVKVWVGITGLWVAAGGLGVAIRQRRALVASMQERAARLELQRDQEGRLGAVAERARIAREMHDIVSHNLTVMIGLADGAVYALQGAPETSQAAMARVAETGREALDEMRRLLGVLREQPDAGPYEPQPGLDRLDDLLGRVEAAGIPVSIEVSGDPHALSDGLQLSVFRVAQEALTNTLRHAPRPTSAHLALRCGPGRIELEVIDTPGPSSLAETQASAATSTIASPADVIFPGGRGLRGMHERAAAYGGNLQAGPLAGGGWRVRLVIDVAVGAGLR
jgi:signal transduction histidine kinase